MLIGEVPQQHRGNLRVQEGRMIASTLEGIGLHDPTRLRGAVAATLPHEIVEPMRTNILLGQWASTPLAVLVFTAHPYGARIGHLLDEKRAAGFCGVFADHIE